MLATTKKGVQQSAVVAGGATWKQLAGLRCVVGVNAAQWRRGYAAKAKAGEKPQATTDADNEDENTTTAATTSASEAFVGEDLGGGKWRFRFNNHYKAHKLEAPENSSVTTKEELLAFYKEMFRIRRTEVEADKLYKAKHIKGFLHLYSGQEGICVGMEGALTHEDAITTAYRDHGFFITRGGTPAECLAELCGKVTGCSKGNGGSMHMYRRESNFFGGNGIVGAQVPIGAGVALALKHLKKRNVSIALYGDGAANQGQVFETYNMAALWKLPAIFICENNKYGMGTSVERASFSTEYYKRGDYVPGLWVDGMDVLAVKEAMKFAKEWALEKGPIVLEMETYRYSGHSMSDPGTSYRSREEVALMRKTRDPIEKTKARILENKIATAEELKAIDQEVKEEIEAAIKFALESPFPPPEQLYADVYAEPTPIRAVELVNSFVPSQ
ncbi:Pyruvate dehydrogenase E1 component subunit alpha-2, mitochondrial [Balamuthia mandrillaris]